MVMTTTQTVALLDLTTNQRLALSCVRRGTEQTDAHVLGRLTWDLGLTDAEANEAIDSLLDLGLLRPTICARRDERFGHVAMLARD